MEVTDANFKEILPKIEETIKNCTFLAIDCEFSGLNTVSEINAFDTPQQYFEKVHKNCKDFLIIQYGISAFRFVPDDETFKQQSFNFYVFRRPVNGNIPDQRFLCQTTSINFLIKQGFDFNKLFKSGIPYLNVTEEEKYRENLKEKQKIRTNLNQNSETVPIPENQQEFIKDVVKQLREFLKSDLNEIELPKCNSFVRRLIYQTVRQKFKEKISLTLEKSTENLKGLVATKFKSLEELALEDQKLAKEELANLNDFIGISRIMRLIVDSGKLVVGHNMCLDFFHMIDKFLTPLSGDYEEFKDCAHSLLPKIVDTKFVAASDAFKDRIPSTALGDLLKTLSKQPFKTPTIEIEDGGQGYRLEDSKQHEAGFDSFMTGVCFLSMWQHLGKLKGVEDIYGDFSLLSPYLNKIFLMYLRDNQFIHLGGQDPCADRDHVFYLTFPRTWKLTNILDLFSPFGNVHVAWINESSAYVGLFKREQASVALSTLSQSDTYSIMTFAMRQSLLRAPPYSVDKSDANSSSTENLKRRSDSTPSRSSKRPKIEETVENEVYMPSILKKNTKKCKTFTENDAWD